MKNFIQRFGDIGISLLALVMLMPVWLIISVSIFLENPGPVFYYQKRTGKNAKLFTIIKFRSMRPNNIPSLELGAVKHRHHLVTKVGYLIRRFKIDETPQFLNILKGDMSLVGPRPCLPERLASMTAQEKRRFNVRPGLTGWAEVNGNVELSWEEQLLLDLWYVDNQSLSLDFAIMFKTISVIFWGSHKNITALANARRNKH